MPKPSLTQKLGKRPSRSYLSGLGDAGGDAGSVVSGYGSDRPSSLLAGGAARGGHGSQQGDPINDTGSLAKRIHRRSVAASESGMSPPSARMRTMSGDYDRYSPSGSNNRRSVTWNDMNPALFDGGSSHLKVMSDFGDYGRNTGRGRTYSVASSIDGGIDGASDAGSTMSQSRRVRRGSKSEKVTRSASTKNSMDLWHNSLGGKGIPTLTDPSDAIVQRKSSMSSTKKFLEKDPQPSRRYSMQPATSANGQPGSGPPPSMGQAAELLGPSKDGTQQRTKSGLDSVASSSSGATAKGLNGQATSNELKRSSSVSSTGSKKSTTKSSRNTSQSSSISEQPMPSNLHSTTLKNNLMNMPTPPASPSKKKRTPEQVVEALAKAGLLERVMEVVQEADEEDSGVSGNEGSERESVALPSTTKQNGFDVSPISLQQQQNGQGSIPTMYIAPQAGHAPTASSSAPLAQKLSEPDMRRYNRDSAATFVSARDHDDDNSESEGQPSRAEQVQTPASESEFATPPSTPPDTPTATEAPAGAPWGNDANGLDTPKQQQMTATGPNAQQGQRDLSSFNKSTGYDQAVDAPAQQTALSQTDIIISAGIVPIPSGSGGPPVKLESLSALSVFDPHLVSRSLQGTILVLAHHNLAMIFARLTWNNWANYEEVAAIPFAPASTTGGEDLRRYQFTWSLPPGTNAADVQLALRLEDGSTNQAHWDNNDGANYRAALASIQRRQSPSQQNTPTGSGQATPVSTGTHEVGSAIPPRVFLVRTSSDNSRESNVLYDPNRRSVVMDGGLADLATQNSQQSASSLSQHGMHPLQPQQSQQQPNQLHNTDSASTISSYSVPTPTGSVNDGTGPTYPRGAIPKYLVHDEAINTSLPSSRAQSISSRASGDSTNAPFHYPSRAAVYQASALQQQNSLRRRASRDTTHSAADMPNIMSAVETKSGAPDDLAGLYTSGGRNPSQGSFTNVNSQSTPPMSVNSENESVGARSNGGISTTTVPAAPLQNSKPQKKPFSLSMSTSGIITLPNSNSTMRALTLTSNAAQTLGRGFWRNNTQKSLRQNPKLPDHMNGKLGTSATITYSNLTPVPHKVRGDECLVQVFACAIDFWDRAKVEILHTRGQGYGFVPGRAFVGKVLEVGYEVDAKKVKKGDFVYGLADLRKSGALAEYVTVNRNMLSQAPNGVLSLEQIAAVALSGIAAFQAMDELCSTLPRGSKLIILNAHEGVGALALQLGQSLRPAGDLWLIGHYPSDFSDGDSILRQLGAAETLCGEAVHALQSLRESTYDAVLDTIGGRKIYDTSKRILHDDGYFVTTVGDALSMPTAKANWKKSLKALFKNRDRKNIMYWFPSVDADARASLIRLREISETGALEPVVKRVYKFEDGAKAFQGASEQAVIMLIDQDAL